MMILPIPTLLRSFAPTQTRLVGYFSTASAVAAVAAIIYGIAVNTIALVVLGFGFLSSSLMNRYLLHKIAGLESVEQGTQKIQTLTADLVQKTRENEILSANVETLSAQLTALQQAKTEIRGRVETGQRTPEEVRKTVSEIDALLNELDGNQ